MYEVFRVVPELGTNRDGARHWLTPSEWDQLAVALHEEWKRTLSLRTDIQVLDLMDYPILARSIERDRCMEMVGPISLKSLMRIDKPGECYRPWPLDGHVEAMAWSAHWLDGYALLDIEVRRCPLEGETDWWTGVGLNLFVYITGREVIETYPYSQKQSGFFDDPASWLSFEGCAPLPLTRGGRRVDAKALAEVLSAELHRRASANLAALPPMNQPWPADP